jgi:hypothetical protein
MIPGFEEAIQDTAFQDWYPEVGTWEPKRWIQDQNLQGQVLNHYAMFNEGTGTPPPPPPNPFENGLDQSTFLAWVQEQGFPANNEGLAAAVDALNQFPGYEHVRVVPHAGYQHKVDFGGNIGVIDLIVGASTGAGSWGWGPVGAGGDEDLPGDVSQFPTIFDPAPGGDPGFTPGLGPSTPAADVPSFYIPPEQPFDYPTPPPAAPTPPAPFGGGPPPPEPFQRTSPAIEPFAGQAPTIAPFSRQAPQISPFAGAPPTITPFAYGEQAPAVPTYSPFEGPSIEDARSEPGYDFRLTEGIRALENSAAARGVTRGGGTLKDIISFGQAFGEGAYQNLYNRAFNTWGANQNQLALGFNQGMDRYTSGHDRALAAWQSDVGAQQARFGQEIAAYNADAAGRQAAYNQELSAYDANARSQLAGFDAELAAYNASVAGRQAGFNQDLAAYDARIGGQQVAYNQAMADYQAQVERETLAYNQSLAAWQSGLQQEATRAGFGLDQASQAAGGRAGRAASLIGDRTGNIGNLLSLYGNTTSTLPVWSPTPAPMF